MSDTTYRITELNKISPANPEYAAKIKLVSIEGGTKWLDITDKELLAIKNILTV